MLRMSVEGLVVQRVDRIVAVVLKEHVEKYQFIEGVKRQFEDYPVPFEFLILDQPTTSQMETVIQGILQLRLENQPVAIKDCDNTIRAWVHKYNCIATARLDKFELINARNKSYVAISPIDSETCGGRVKAIAEKEIISDTFCVGLYCFASSDSVIAAYNALQPSGDLRPSDIIRQMMATEPFFSTRSENYIDWGTYEDWRRYCGEFQTIFIDLDGTLVHNAGSYTSPKIGETDPLNRNIEWLRRKRREGKVYIVITTSRSKEFAELTIKQLLKHDIPYDKILFGLPHCRRVLINDYAPSNPFPSCSSLSIPRDADILPDLMP
jgi:hypothetical protein